MASRLAKFGWRAERIGHWGGSIQGGGVILLIAVSGDHWMSRIDSGHRFPILWYNDSFNKLDQLRLFRGRVVHDTMTREDAPESVYRQSVEIKPRV